MVFSKFKLKRKKGVAKLFNPLMTPLKNAWIMRNKKPLTHCLRKVGSLDMLRRPYLPYCIRFYQILFTLCHKNWHWLCFVLWLYYAEEQINLSRRPEGRLIRLNHNQCSQIRPWSAPTSPETRMGTDFASLRSIGLLLSDTVMAQK